MSVAKKILYLLCVNSLSMTVIFYGVEWMAGPYARLPKNGYIKGERYTWGHLVANNRHGFRERNFATPKPAGVYRVMVLGDSLTWGVGLAVEERYTAVAEELLNQAFDNDRTFEVLNFGIGGGPTVQERDILRDFNNAVQPDYIVVGFCLNDSQPKEQNYSVERERLRHSPAGRLIHGVSRGLRAAKLPYISSLLTDALYLLAEKNGSIPSWQQAIDRTYDPQSREWQEFMQALTDIKNTSDELHLPPPMFAVLNQGTFTDRPTDYTAPDEYLRQYLRWYHQAERAAREIGFLAYNHEEEIARQLPNRLLVINELDAHPSAALNRIYGEKLARVIIEQILRQP